MHYGTCQQSFTLIISSLCIFLAPIAVAKQTHEHFVCVIPRTLKNSTLRPVEWVQFLGVLIVILLGFILGVEDNKVAKRAVPLVLSKEIDPTEYYIGHTLQCIMMSEIAGERLAHLEYIDTERNAQPLCLVFCLDQWNLVMCRISFPHRNSRCHAVGT